VFDRASIENLTKRSTVLVAMTADVGSNHDGHPARRLLSIDVLDEGERADLDEWAIGRFDPARPCWVSIRGVGPASGGHAGAVAVVCGERSLTYRQLDEASNRLAHLLADRVRPGQCVRC